MASKKLIKKLDVIFSRYIRLKDSKNGKVKCFTCPKVEDWKKMHCGHFQVRRHMATRWNPNNCKPQCPGCNTFREGEQYIFANNLNKIKKGLADEMMKKARKPHKWADYELQALIYYYTKEVKKLEECHTKKNP